MRGHRNEIVPVQPPQEYAEGPHPSRKGRGPGAVENHIGEVICFLLTNPADKSLVSSEDLRG